MSNVNKLLPPGKLNLCHGNTQSLCIRQSNKLEEPRYMMYKSKVEIACCTESWLTSKIDDRGIAIAGYQTVQNDRVFKRGGRIVVQILQITFLLHQD